MARIKEAPKQGAQKPSSPSSDDDAAAQQLLAESNSPVANPPPPSAVLGANLLNAARVNQPPNSIAPWMVRKHGPGKLKRVSFPGEGSRQNLASRGDPYEIEMSPEKGRYTLPEKVNHQPLKVNRKKKKPVKEKKQAVEEESVAPVASSELPVHEENLPQVEQDEGVEDGQVPQVEQDERMQALALPQHEIRSLPPELALLESNNVIADTIDKERSPSVSDVPTGVPEDHTGTKAKSKRKSESDHGEDAPSKVLREQRQTTGESMSSRKRHPQVRIPAQRSTQQQDAVTTTGRNNDVQETQKCVGIGSVHQEKSRPGPARQEPRSRKEHINGTIASSQRLPTKKRRQQGQQKSSNEAPKTAVMTGTEIASVAGEPEHESDSEGSGNMTDEGSKTVRPTGKPGSIETVFEFLNLDSRPGKCQTELATTIRRACNTYSAHLQESDLSMDTVIEDANELQETLRQVSTGVEKKDQRAFKFDAYGHVFRALTLYLEAIYIWLHEHVGEVTDSLEAMQILSSLIHQILACKDTIADWAVNVPKRYKGDRIIKDVDIGLIAHLRQVDKTYRKHLSRLKAAEQNREIQANYERRMKEIDDEEDRKAKTFESRTERWKRWQDLHIKRMICEPDARKRSKLAIKRFEDVEERDANGVVFERLPVFTPRSAPPHRQVLTLDDSPEWTEQEETALLDGLKRYAGPQVYEKIFTVYCRPDSSHPLGGHLRERSVAEIVTKAAQFRADLQKLYRDNCWEVEDWVTKIPVLP